MGVVNVTPDSFSDGGDFLDPKKAIARGLRMLEEGADIVDVGGESTRPGAAQVDAETEKRRVLPVIEALAGAGAAVSIDARKIEVAQAALAVGAAAWNNIDGFCDPRARAVAAAAGCGAVAMHMRGEPATMQNAPVYGDVAREVGDFLRARADDLIAAGVGRDCVCLDPGFGFGKTHAHNLALFRALPALCESGYPIMIGISRKSFLGRIVGKDAKDRDAAGLGAMAWARIAGAAIFRVHDARATRDALAVCDAIAGGD